MKRARSAFTIAELVVLVVILVVIGAIGIPVLVKQRADARRVKDATQIRAIHGAMVTWAGNGQDSYPLMGSADLNDTVPGSDTSSPETRGNSEFKNLPRFSMSVLMYMGWLTPEVFVSPSETNSLIRPDTAYEFTKPTAVDPAKRNQAFFDPAFACYPDEEGGDVPIKRGNGVAPGPACSYAFVPFIGARRFVWQSTFDANQVVIGNRGPWYKRDAQGRWSLDPTDLRGKSNTPATASNSLRIHGPDSSWEGNIARNDNSVQYETQPDPASLTFKYEQPYSVERMAVPDNIFANEAEEGDEKWTYARVEDRVSATNYNRRQNNYLRCWGGDGKGSNITIDPVQKRANSIVNFWYD